MNCRAYASALVTEGGVARAGTSALASDRGAVEAAGERDTPVIRVARAGTLALASDRDAVEATGERDTPLVRVTRAGT